MNGTNRLPAKLTKVGGASDIKSRYASDQAQNPAEETKTRPSQATKGVKGSRAAMEVEESKTPNQGASTGAKSKPTPAASKKSKPMTASKVIKRTTSNKLEDHKKKVSRFG